MPKVHELGDCPLCFGRLLPLSVCQSCNSVSVREGLDEVVPQIVCEDCGATNATHFVCSACNARFPYGDIVKAEGPTCPVCHKPVPVGAQLCPHCSAVLPVGAAGGRSKRRIRGEYGDEDVHEVGRIPGVGRPRAEALCEAGYNALWKIARASEGELAKVRGIGATDAAAIKDALRFLLLVGRKKSKEEVLSEECECPLCGTLTSLFATHCHGCGALFDEEELDEEFREEVEREPEKGLLAFYDVRLLENPESVPLLYARAILLLSLGRPAEALAGLDRVLELEPGHPRTLQAKARALAGAKGIGSAAQILRDVVSPPAGQKPVGAVERSAVEDAALKTLAALEEAECPECGERQAPGAKVCPVCGHRFAPEEPARGPAPLGAPEERLLEELERAVAGESKAPPPPLRPEVPDVVVEKKRSMLAFLLKLPGVSRRAAEAVSGFFQDLDQIALSDMADLADIPGVAPMEARLIKEAVDEVVQPVEERLPPAPPLAAAPPRPPPHAPPREREVPPIVRPGPTPRPAAPAPVPAAPRPRAMEITAGRRGLINGRGLVNGRGRVNGLINGSGFINGSSVAEPHVPRKNLAPRYLAIGASMIMLFAVAAVFIPGSPPTGIRIDGSFQDWDPVPHYTVGTDSANPNVDLQSVSLEFHAGSDSLFLRASVRGVPFDTTNYDTMYVFLQTDSQATSGYAIAGLPTDFMVRVSGANRTVKDARLLQYTPIGGSDDDWTGWHTVGGTVEAATGADRDGGAIEVAVPADSLAPLREPRASFALDDNAGNTSASVVPVADGFGSLVVTERALNTVVTASGGPQLLMELEFAAYGGEATVNGLTVSQTPGATFGGVPSTPFVIPLDTSRSFNITVDPSGFSSGSVVRAAFTAVATSSPYMIVGPEGRAYVNGPPAGRRIDGLFRDWSLPRNDTNPARRPALDIRQYDGAVQGNDVYAYARLAGSALEGVTIPDRLLAPVSGGGGPGGNQTAPMPPPPRFGEDTVRFYISTNASAPGGVPVNGLRVDRLLEVRGRDGSVTNASLFRWSGQSWRWEARAQTGVGDHEIEVNATVAGVAFNNTQIVAATSDWAGVADVTNAATTRGGGTRGGPASSPIVMDISANGKFWFRDTNHATETDCTYNKVASSTKGPGPLKTITLGSSGERACWYVDETTGQTISAGDWETLMDLSSTDSTHYDVRMEIWNKDTDTVAETIGTCLDQTAVGDDVQCLQTGVPSKTVTSNQVVRLVLAWASGTGTISIDYDNSGTSGDSRATLPIPEFSDFMLPAAIVLLAVPFGRWRRRRSKVRVGPN